MRSNKSRVSQQSLSQVPHVAPHYIITSGAELVEVGTTLVFMEQAALDYVRLNGEDVAIWHLVPEESPRLCSFVRPLAQGGAALHYV